MFARNVHLHLKPHSVSEFSQTVEKQIIPLLRKQKGFHDLLAFVAPGETEAVAISLWEEKTNAETYHRGTYPEVLKALAKVVDGTPQVHSFEVSNSTFHKIASRVAI